MKKKNVTQMARTALSGLLILGMVLGNTAYTEAKKVTKQESVYAIAGADGVITEITVADWLQDSGLVNGSIKDNSELTDITNVKGDESFSQSDSSVEWTLSGQDIYYQGRTTKELPVSMKISYTLDGVPMSPQDMPGKSGKLEMHVVYTNHSKQMKEIGGKKRAVYTPFIMITGMILPSDHFSNVSIDNGRVINDGSNNIVVGMGLPGLVESLGLDGDAADNIPAEFTVKAEVVDFSIGNTFTFGSPSLMNEIDLDDVESLDELEDKLDDLTDAAGKLVDGSDELADGMQTYDEKMGELKASIKKYNKEGVKEITKGIRTLAKGGTKLVGGVKEYTDGVTELANGTKSYVAGADQIAKGNSDLYAAVKGLPAQIKTFHTGLTTYTGNVDKMGAKENVTKLKAGTKAVSDGISSVNDAVKGLKGLQTQEKQLVAGLKAKLAAAGVADEEINTMIGTMEQLLAGEDQYISGLDESTGADSTLKQGADAVAANVATVMDGLNTLSSNSSTLTDASGQLNTQVPVLVANIKKLKEGGETLTANDKKLNAGANKLIKAGKTMKKSVKKLNKGMSTLNKGGKSLGRSTEQLVSGISQLETASGKLVDGSDELAEGMAEFNKEGIKKLNEAYEDDFKTLLDRLKAIAEAGREYNNFSGIGNGMKGDVKFVIETEAVNKE